MVAKVQSDEIPRKGRTRKMKAKKKDEQGLGVMK